MTGWQPGDTVVLRYFKRGRPSGVMPTRAVSTNDGPVLWMAPGTMVGWPGVAGRHAKDVPAVERFSQPWEVVERPWTGDGVLIVGRPGRAHSIWLVWERGGFVGWYVNLEDPWRASRYGFDTQDHELDLWVDSDGSWRWKDEQDLEAAVEAGFFTSEQAASFRAEGEGVLAEWPFPTGWESWQPDPSWPLPVTPGDWAAQSSLSEDQ
ncbi:MAG TPA: DUF402 domain-containing protein [Gaiellaceae bacterium]|nr:DUF402 domain-containing protein [Gaiellaceae bacterium]